MSKVDWSLAPEGVTHYGVVSSGRICWYSVKSDCRYDYAYQNEGYHAEKWTPSGGAPGHQPLIARPQPKQWSGPQDGLPPVGLRVDYMGDHCTVVAHVNERWQKGAILQGDEDWFYGTEITIDPIKTPEQLAAEQRETAIREIMDIADVDCRITAARLVDAGFKREDKDYDGLVSLLKSLRNTYGHNASFPLNRYDELIVNL